MPLGLGSFLKDCSVVYGNLGLGSTGAVLLHMLRYPDVKQVPLTLSLVDCSVLAGTSIVSPRVLRQAPLGHICGGCGIASQVPKLGDHLSVTREPLVGATYLICVCIQAKRSIPGGDAVFRWLKHHGMLVPHDAIIVGAISARTKL